MNMIQEDNSAESLISGKTFQEKLEEFIVELDMMVLDKTVEYSKEEVIAFIKKWTK